MGCNGKTATYMSCLSRIVALCNRQTDGQTDIRAFSKHPLPSLAKNSAVQHRMIQKFRLVAERSARAARPGDRYALPGRPGRPAKKHCTTMLFLPDVRRLRQVSVWTSRTGGPDVRAGRPGVKSAPQTSGPPVRAIYPARTDG